MNESRSTMAQQIAQAAFAFEKQRTGNHVPESVTVMLSDNTLAIVLHEALLPAEKALAQTSTGSAHVQEFYRQLFSTADDAIRREIKRITGIAVQEAAAVVQAFKTGTVVQVFLLDGRVPTETWSGTPSSETPSSNPTTMERS
jgi:uncharacterized protein YbcI